MNATKIQKTLDELRERAESEVVEFKGSVNDNYSTSDIGKYFSAIANEANLKGLRYGWLIFGVDDKGRNVIGTTYRNDAERLNSLKLQIAENTTGRTSFIDIYSSNLPSRVILFCIPAAPRGIPVAWKGHFYAREGESLVPLGIEKIERIRKALNFEDWSKQICLEATIDDLDARAIIRARDLFKQRFPDISSEVDEWDDPTFLNKSKVSIQGQITNTAIILLGKSESEHFISPAVAKIRWLLKDSKGNDRDYLIGTCPLILSINEIFGKIRNVLYRLEKRDELFPEEMLQYSPDLIYEALNNCIAHQDYTFGARVNVIEKEDEIIFTNYGDFIPGSVEKVLEDDAPEERYRNDFLCTAMFNFRMVQTRGGGIRMMFKEQAERHFPLPEYDLSDNKVKVTIVGKVLDIDYASVLARDETLTLPEIVMLDKVQKKKRLTPAEFHHLKGIGLIEGRRPNVYISAKVAERTGQKATYAKFRAFDSSYYQDLILQALKGHGTCSRQDFDELIHDKLPDWMTERQKKTKVGNLLYGLKKRGRIENLGSDRNPAWVLIDEGIKEN
ncbi:MAG: putative DNA binding domain-containing protein [Acidobacteria bacterium]|nr:putative DNA binding domain-containing protein [Acidobacteriota bacterium]